MLSTKGLIDEVPEEYLSHKEKYENAIRKAVLLYRAMKDAEDPNQTEQEKAKYVNFKVSCITCNCDHYFFRKKCY